MPEAASRARQDVRRGHGICNTRQSVEHEIRKTARAQNKLGLGKSETTGDLGVVGIPWEGQLWSALSF